MYYDLKEAQAPESFIALVEQALDVFWDSYRAEFPEVTSGDSQMCDEPSNTIALWLAPSAKVELPSLTVCNYSLSLPQGCNEKRVDKALDKAITSMIEVLKEDLPSLEKPNQDTYRLMHAVYCDVLHWNFPEKKIKNKKM